MKTFILINAILETLAGITFLFMPTLAPGTEDTSADGLIFLRMYGGAALAVGIAAFIMWQNYESADMRKIFVTLFSIFHTGVASANAIGYNSGEESCLPVLILHGVLAIISIYFFTKHK